MQINLFASACIFALRNVARADMHCLKKIN